MRSGGEKRLAAMNHSALQTKYTWDCGNTFNPRWRLISMEICTARDYRHG
jgi:hypothetical protein